MFKYLGQHIFDFVSKFRNKVYFENLKGSSGMLNVADDGEVTKVPTVSNIDTWHLSDTNKLDLNPPESNPTGITFKPDGTKAFVLGYSLNRVQMYDLSTAWDLTSAGSATESEYLVQGGLSSTQEDFFIDSSGTRMYVLSRSSDSVGQFTLNTAWDISDITFVRDVHMNSTSLSGGVAGFVTGETNPMGMTFKPDGTIMYITGYTTDDVFQIPLSTAWDISTHGTITSVDVSIEGTPNAVQFNDDGTVMYIMGYSTDAVHEYNLSTAWDVTTASFIKRATAFIRTLEGTGSGFYYNETQQKAFLCGRSSDFAYEVIVSKAIRFSDPVSAEVIQGDRVMANQLITGYSGYSSFFNSVDTHSTFRSYSTTYLGYNTGAQNVRVGNTVYGNYRFHVFQNNYINTDFINNPTGALPNIRFFNPFIGGVGVFSIGKTHNTSSVYLRGGITDIESEADTFDHLGEFTLGGELKITGNQPLKYKDPNLYTQGTQIVLDNFTESTQTTLDNHTPDTGSGYTNVYISSGISFPTHLPIIEANNGFLRPAVNNSNDGYRFVNDTTISTANYEARAVIRKQVNSDDPFVLFVKYIDEDNYFAMHFSANYNYCTPMSVVGGVYTQHGALYYYANTSTADDVNFEVALRVVGNNVHVFYEGRYRGSREVNITGIGKAGIGFGKSNNSILTSYDLSTNAQISKFEIYELPDSLFGGSDSVHYIENGSLGIGTTSPTSKLHVEGTSKFVGQGTWPMQMINDVSSGNAEMGLWTLSNAYAATKNFSLIATPINNQPVWYFQAGGDGWQNITLQRYGGKVGIRTLEPSAHLTVQGGGTTTGKTFLAQDSNASALFTILDSGNVGIGTTSPYAKLHLSGTTGAESAIRQSRVGVKIWDSQIDSSGRLTWSHYASEGGTANQLFTLDDNSNVGIGTTAPSFKLDVNAGTENIVASFSSTDQTAQLRIVESSNVPFFFGVINTGAYISPTGATPADGISIINTGNVGIGIASPAHKLDVNGDARLTNLQLSDFTGDIYFGVNSANNKFSYNQWLASASGGMVIKNTANASTGHIAFETSTGEALRIIRGGDVGIGTTSPLKPLHVDNANGARISYESANMDLFYYGIEFNRQSNYLRPTTNSGKSLYIGSGSQNYTWGTVYLDAAVVQFRNSSSEPLMRFDSSTGRLGIGTTSPIYKLDVNGEVKSDAYRIDLSATTQRAISSTGTDSIQVGDAGVNDIKFKNASGNSVTITSAGRLGIGVTNPSRSLHVLTTGWNGILSESSTTNGAIIRIKNTQREFELSSRSDSFQIRDITDSDTNRFIINSTGKVGIGTTSPAGTLHVVGASGGAGEIYVSDVDNGTGSSDGLLISKSGTNAFIYNRDNGQISFGTNNASSNLVITNTGNVGIGTTSPAQTLHVNSGGTNTTAIFESTDGNANITIKDNAGEVALSAGGNSMYFKTSSSQTTKMAIVGSAGNVGIGTTSPSYNLTVYNDSTTDSFPIVAGSGLSVNEFVGIGLSGFVASNGAVKAGMVLDRVGNYGTGDIHFLNNSTEDNNDATLADSKLVIKENGNVGIGTTSPARLLHVNSSGQTDIHLTSTNQGTASTDGMTVFLDASGTGGLWLRETAALRFATSATERMRIDSSGNVGIGTTAPSATLDIEDASGVTIDINSSSGDGQFRFQDNAVTKWSIGRDNTQQNFVFSNSAGLSNDNVLVLTHTDGNVGIGITNPSEKLDVVGNIKASGTIKGKMEQMFACSFSDDLGTTKHYIPFTSNAEQTNVHADQVAMVMPYGGRVKCIQMRLSNIDADTTRTLGIESIAPGVNMFQNAGNWTSEETEAYELVASDDYYLVNYVFSNETHFDSGDLLAISIQDSEDAHTASRQIYMNVIIEYDLNNGMGNDTATTKYTS